MMRGAMGLASISLLVLPLCAFGPVKQNGRLIQHLEVLSYTGAVCRLFRDGSLLGKVTLSGSGTHSLSPVIDVDVTKSKSDILVVCRLGDRAFSRIAQFGPVSYIIDFANNCIIPPNATPEDLREADECAKNFHSAVDTEMEYPEIIRLPFHRVSPQVPQ